MNEIKMSYGPKTNKSSINHKSIESKQPTPSMNFVSKGMFDPKNSFTCADKVVDSKCGDILGGEQVFNSDFSETSFHKTDSGCVFGQVFLIRCVLMCRLVGLMFWAKLLMVVSLRIHLVKPLKLLLKKIKNVLIVLLYRSQWTSLILKLVGPHWKP
ncbi:hypothetical protein Hanom_Chr05g00437361 [Helianthus anomalus]